MNSGRQQHIGDGSGPTTVVAAADTGTAAAAVAQAPPTAARPPQWNGGNVTPQQQAHPQGQTSAEAEEGTEVIVHHRPQRPQVPPKPQLDIVRYSMANAKDDLDLDTILQELLELENQLSGEAGDQLILGLPSLPASTSSQQLHQPQQQPSRSTAAAAAQLPPIPYQSSILPQRKQQQVGNLSPPSGTVLQLQNPPMLSAEFCASPDIDSAFGDSSSGASAGSHGSGGSNGNRCRNSEISSVDSYRGSLNTPSPTHQASPNSNGAGADVSSNTIRTPSSTSTTHTSNTSNNTPDLKAEKIREALEKMKEAKMKKIYVKLFLEDGSTKGLLIDERWTVAETMRQLAEKLNIALTPDHAIIEEYPDLHIKRLYEDHERVVENIEDWVTDSKNKLHFRRSTAKYNFIRQPQLYLQASGGDTGAAGEVPPSPAARSSLTSGREWTSEAKGAILKAFLDSESNVVPELEGWLLLKADGKKSWKRQYFQLRSSGLYVAKGGKTKTKDLQCLMNVYNNQIYTSTDWKKKYKAPTEFGFAIKHPRVQVKTSKYIKYICCEDERSFRQWVTSLRIMRNGFNTLYKSYCDGAQRSAAISSRLSTASVPIRVELPHISLQRLSTLNGGSSSTATLSNCHSPATGSIKSTMTTSSNGGGGRTFGQKPYSNGVVPLQQQQQQRDYRREGSSSGTSSGIVFDQDECGTIKRQPTFTEHHHPHQPSPYLQQQPQQQEELDSDEEEQLPPPPPPVPVAETAVLFRNGGGGGAEVRAFSQQQPPPRLCSMAAMPLVSPKPQMMMGTAQVARKVPPPPPPPKRADTTRLQNAPSPAVGGGMITNGGGGAPAKTPAQMDLYTELQRATMRQKQRIEGK